MKKLVLVYNPRSAHHELIKKEVLGTTRTLPGWMIAKFEVKPLSLVQNVERLARILDDGDLVIVAGGDGTAAMALNGILASKKRATLGVLGYGHFNDFAHTLGTMHPVEYGDDYLGGVAELVRKFDAGETRDFYPLEVKIDGKFWRFAACYVTLGMAAKATEMFEEREIRKNMPRTSHLRSYFRVGLWYYKNRKKHQFLPALKLNDQEMSRATDVIALNAPYMAKVMHGDKWYEQPDKFAAGGFWLQKSWTLFKFMMRSMFKKVPLREMSQLEVEFEEPARLMIQSEGEYEMLEGAQKIEIKKGPKVTVI